MAQGIVRVTPGSPALRIQVETVDNPNPYGIRVGQFLSFNPPTFPVSAGNQVNFTAISATSARVNSVNVAEQASMKA